MESQLTELGASYRESVNTAPHYRLYRLDTVPEKPGMVYDDKKGAAIAVDIYELPVVSVGAFLGEIRKPLCIGNVELSDGRIVKGFFVRNTGWQTQRRSLISGSTKCNNKDVITNM